MLWSLFPFCPKPYDPAGRRPLSPLCHQCVSPPPFTAACPAGTPARGTRLRHAACLEATRFGINPRQAAHTARPLCPTATFAPADPAADVDTFGRVLTHIEAHTDQIEPVTSPQSPHFTLAVPVKRPADALDLAKALGRTLRAEVGLDPALVVAGTLFTAKTVATLTPPGNVRMISDHYAPDVLAALPLSILALSDEVQSRLHRLGIYRVGQFAALPASTIVQQFGKEARVGYDRAHGRDTTPLRPRVSTPAIEIPFLFYEPITYDAPLYAALDHLATRIGAELLAQRVSATVLWLTIRCEDRSRQERCRTVRVPIRTAREVITELGLLFRQMRVEVGITEVRAIAQGFVPVEVGSGQLSFLDRLTPTSIFEQWWPRLLQRHGHAPFKRVVWAENRAGLAWEDQFTLHPF